MKIKFSVFLSLFVLFFAGTASAKFSYEGQLTDLSDMPISNQAASIKISLLNPAAACVLFQEVHSITTTDKGHFFLQIGAGTDVDGLTNSLDSIFGNAVVLSGMSGCTYTPVLGDDRRMKVEVNTGSGYELLGLVIIGKSPQAAHADSVGGFDSTKLVRSSGTAPLLSSAEVTALSQLIAGTSTLYITSGTGGTLTNVTATAPLTSSGGTTPNISLTKANASQDGFISSSDWTTFNNKLGTSSALLGDISGTFAAASVIKIRGFTVSTNTPATGNVLQFDGTQYVPTAPTAAPVASVAGRTGAVTLASADISGLGSAASMNIGTTAGTVAAGDDARLTGAFQSSTSLSGDVTGTLPSPTVATVGGRTASEINTSVTDTLAATNANTTGTIVKRDGSGNIVLNAVSSVNASTNNVYVYNAGNTNYARIKTPSPMSGDYTLTLPATVGSNGQVLSTNASGDLAWANASAGSITNVTATAPLASTGSATPNISLTKATSTSDGYLASSDFTIFNNKLGTSTNFSGDVSGTSSTTSVDKIKGTAVTIAALAASNYLRFDGSAWKNSNLVSTDITTSLGFTPVTSALSNGNIYVGNPSAVATAVMPSGDISNISNSGIFTFVNTAVVAGTYGSASAVPSFTVDSKGRITAAGSQAYQDATGASKGIVQTGANITNSSGVISVASTNVTNALGFIPYNPATQLLVNPGVASAPSISFSSSSTTGLFSPAASAAGPGAGH